MIAFHLIPQRQSHFIGAKRTYQAWMPDTQQPTPLDTLRAQLIVSFLPPPLSSTLANSLRRQQLPSPGCIVIGQGWDRRLAVVNGYMLPKNICGIMQGLYDAVHLF